MALMAPCRVNIVLRGPQNRAYPVWTNVCMCLCERAKYCTCMRAMKRKKALAARLICSYRKRGRNVRIPYLAVLKREKSNYPSLNAFSPLFQNVYICFKSTHLDMLHSGVSKKAFASVLVKANNHLHSQTPDTLLPTALNLDLNHPKIRDWAVRMDVFVRVSQLSISIETPK